MATERRARSTGRLLLPIVAVFSALAIGYGLVIPILEVPDEMAHVEYAVFVAAFRELPPFPAPFFEAHQPPLYYASLAPVAAMLGWGTPAAFYSHPDLVRMPVNPRGFHFQGPDPRFFVHSRDEAFPYRGDALLVHVLRLASLPLGIVVIVSTYVLARRLVPDDESVGFLAAGFVALVPYFDLLSGAVNNDALANAVGALLIVAMAASLLGEGDVRPKALVGLLCGVAVLTKLSLLPLAVAAGVSVMATSARRGHLLRGSVALLAGAVAIAGWYLACNVVLHGDPLALRAQREHYASIGQTVLAPPRDLGQWARYLFVFARSVHDTFWGSLGALDRPLPSPVYAMYDLVLAVAAAGLVRRVMRTPLASWSRRARVLAVLAGLLPLQIACMLARDQSNFSAVGRFLYMLLPVIGLLVSLGVLQHVPRRHREATARVVLLSLAGVGAWTLFGFVAPLYAVPQTMPTEPVAVRINDVRFPWLRGCVVHGQTFVARADGLRGIEVRLGTYGGRASAPLTLTLKPGGPSSPVIARTTVMPPHLVDNGFAVFRFPPIEGSADHAYYFQLEVPADGGAAAPAVWATRIPPADAVQRYVDGQPAIGSLQFRAAYE